MDIRPDGIVYGSNGEELRVISFLDNGSFGQVFKIATANGDEYALKTIITASLNNDQLAALINEAKLSVTIDHENVIKAYFFHDGNTYSHLPPYLIMEYASDGTLLDIIKRQKDANHLLSNKELRDLFLQLSSGMKAINDKVIHRDIKPDNILLKESMLKISDFGLSKAVNAATRSSTFKGIQHIKYSAPEALRSEKNTISMDIYSMGIVFYELATLRHPLEVKAVGDIIEAWRNAHLTQLPTLPNTINTSLDLNLTQLIMKMIAKRPEERYSSWDEIISRIMSTEQPAEKGYDISALVKKTITKTQREEEFRLKQEAEQMRIREKIGAIMFAFTELATKVGTIVQAFNDSSDSMKLELRKRGEFSFAILCSHPGRMSTRPKEQIEVMIERVSRNYVVNNMTIIAWGYLKTGSGRGFNLILVSGEDEIYGKWIKLEASHNPIGRRRDFRPEPFPFELKELPKEIIHIVSMNIYNTKISDLVPESFIPFIEELIDRC